MKLKYLLLIFTSFLFINPIKAMTPNVKYIDEVYGNKIGDKIYSSKFGYITDNGEYLYCIDPFRYIGDNYNIDDNLKNNFSKEDLDYFKLVANYDKIALHQTYYYMAAQQLIWEKIIGKDNVFYTLDSNVNGVRHNIDLQLDEIKKYVNNYLTKPSFDGTIIKDNFYKEIVLEDTNNVLFDYKVINNSKNSVWIEGNKLHIKILSTKLEEIKLVRKTGEGDVLFYSNGTNQNIAKLSGEVTIESTIKVGSNNPYNEFVNIEFYSLSGLVQGNIDFKINDQLYNTTNGNYSLNLDDGLYSISTINVPNGFLLSDDVSFEVDEDNMNQYRIIHVFIPIPTGRLNIECPNGIYQLYKQDKKDVLIKTFTESTSIELNLGNYYIIDINNGKLYNVNINYKDQYTNIIEYNLKIDNKSEEINDKEFFNDEYKEDNVDNISNNINVFENKTNYNMKMLPNTINYIKIIKAILIIIIIILIIKHAKELK